MAVRVSSQKSEKPRVLQKRNKGHFFYHKHTRFKVDLNTRTRAKHAHKTRLNRERAREHFLVQRITRECVYFLSQIKLTLERKEIRIFNLFLSAAAAHLRSSSSCPSLKNSRRYSPISTMGRKRSRLYSSSRRTRTPGRDGTILSRLGG